MKVSKKPTPHVQGKPMFARYVLPASAMILLGRLADLQLAKHKSQCSLCGGVLMKIISQVELEIDVE
jgi:hypothetical protein